VCASSGSRCRRFRGRSKGGTGEGHRQTPRLEDQFGTVDGKPQLLLVVNPAGSVLAVDRDNCIRILRECGHLPTGPVSVLNFGRIPVGLSADELEQHLRQHGAEVRRTGPAE
jgi:hypothetical protein